VAVTSADALLELQATVKEMRTPARRCLEASAKRNVTDSGGTLRRLAIAVRRFSVSRSRLAAPTSDKVMVKDTM
jgi:hypothetical protein